MIVFFLTAFKMSSRNIYTSTKWPKSCQEVAESGQNWPEFSEDSRNPSFRLEKITEKCIKNAFIAGGIVDKNGSYDVYCSFLFSSGFFCLKNRSGMVILVR